MFLCLLFIYCTLVIWGWTFYIFKRRVVRVREGTQKEVYLKKHTKNPQKKPQKINFFKMKD